MEVRKKIGEKLRMYRKLRGMTLTELADRIHKSKSVVSKYELGESVCDMDTIYQICEVLDIEPAQLLEPRREMAPQQSKRFGVFRHNQLCVYMLVRDKSYHLLKCMMIFSGDDADTVTLYIGVSDFERYMNCRLIYSGHFQCYYNNVWFYLENPNDASDHAAINAAVRMGKPDTGVGLALMTSYTSNEPGAFKLLFSAEPVDEAEAEQYLKINKEDVAAMKRSNIYGYMLGSIDANLIAESKKEKQN